MKDKSPISNPQPPLLEVEVKFYVMDLPALRQRLLKLGAKLKKPRIFEQNTCYDNGWEGLRREGKLLRLRQDAGTRLTFKGPAPTAEQQSEVKVREEIEVTIDDFTQTALILERVGFEPKQVYEKYRETFQIDGVEVVLDELPYGNFVELEGKDAGIRSLADTLELDWTQRILTTYLHLMAQVKKHYQLDFDDLTFDNFAGKKISIADLLPKSSN